MKAVKGNKVYTITETDQKHYEEQGFDIYSDDEQELIAYGRGKTVPYGDYQVMKEENEALKARIAALETVSDGAEDQGIIEGSAGGKKGGKAGA